MRRKRIGLIYKYNEGWIGGTYYIVNLIHALDRLSPLEKPVIYIFADEESEFLNLREMVKYDHIYHWPFVFKSKWLRTFNFITRKIVGRNLWDNRPADKSLDILFPCNFHPFYDRVPVQKKVYWIPDFQEHHLPGFFSEQEIKIRKDLQLKISREAYRVVFSSLDAKKDFVNLYPDSKAKTEVLHFAVSHTGDYEKLDIEELLKSYSIPGKYFICPNQFWAHKNQALVIQAMELITRQEERVHVVFTGKETDYRDQSYPNKIRQLVKEKNLEKDITFLGFIPRNHLLKLMDSAVAVIQPSLFEGWSTVVEDAKSLNKPVIASNLAVHTEQLEAYPQKRFFDPQSPDELKECMLELGKKEGGHCLYDYDKDVINYSRQVMKLATTKH